jgi:hypothetical protein
MLPLRPTTCLLTLLVATALASCGAGDTTRTTGPARFGAGGERILTHDVRIERVAGAWSMGDGTHSQSELHVGAGDARDGVVLTLAGHAPLRVREVSAAGPVDVRGGGALVHAREGGRAYWTTGEHQGFEEWLELEEGRAHADRAVALWEVDGHALREVPERGGVHVLEDDRPIAYVSAPHAYTLDGREVASRVGVEDGRLALYVDADGAAVLADPLWVATGSLNVARGAPALAVVAGGALIVGGRDASTQLASAERYDELTEAWALVAPMSERRHAHSATRLASGRILVAGGVNDVLLASAEIFDPATNTWAAAVSSDDQHLAGEEQ